MKSLIAKLEAATEGSRELDAEIWRHLGLAPAIGDGVWDWKYMGNGAWHQSEMESTWGRHAAAPHYTTSLDAALTLVPDGLGRGCWAFSRDHYGGCHADVWRNAEFNRKEHGSSKTPALALCIAALKARSTP